MTLRTPNERCEEINKSSTGDFIWEVAYQIAVDDCKRLELLVHKKLESLRQKNANFLTLMFTMHIRLSDQYWIQSQI